MGETDVLTRNLRFLRGRTTSSPSASSSSSSGSPTWRTSQVGCSRFDDVDDAGATASGCTELAAAFVSPSLMRGDLLFAIVVVERTLRLLDDLADFFAGPPGAET